MTGALIAVAIALFALGLLAAPAVAQVSPLLAPDHWAARAAERVEAIGLAPGYLPAQAAVPRGAVASALRGAAERAADHPASDGGLAMAWWLRFQEEFPEYGSAGAHLADGVRLLGSSLGLGVEARRGAAAPGRDEFPPLRTGATPLADRTQAFLGGEFAAVAGEWLAVSAVPVVGTSEIRLDRAEVAIGWRSLRLSGGRGEIGWGTGAGGGVILGGAVPLDRIELATSIPLRLPGWFGLLGPFAFQTFGARMPGDRHPGNPWLLGGTASARPHSRITLSGHRAIMVGGEGVEQRMGVGDILPALIGKNIPGANQIASTSLRVRLPTERLIPLSIYCEWGAEDSAGAPFDAPGLVCGGTSPAMPGAPGLALGLEHAQFGARPLNGPPWYRHHKFPGNWALDEGTLGHPLGGEGRQWLVYSELAALDARLDLTGHAFRRIRTGENLYLPGRDGTSWGGEGTLRWRVSPRAELRVSALRESGEGWGETRAKVAARVIF